MDRLNSYNLYRPAPMAQDHTYVAPLEQRLAARNRTCWDGIRETGDLISAVGQTVPKAFDWVADRIRPPQPIAIAFPQSTYIPDMLSGVGRSLGGTVEAVGGLPRLTEATVKDPLGTGKAMVKAVPHLLDDYAETWEQRGPVASLSQAAADFFGGGAIKKGLALGKTAEKKLVKQVLKDESRQLLRKEMRTAVKAEIKTMKGSAGRQLIQREFPEITGQQLKAMSVKKQKQLARKALKRGTMAKLQQTKGRLKPDKVRHLVRETAHPVHSKPGHHKARHIVHHAVHGLLEEDVKHTLRHSQHQEHKAE